MNNKKNSEKWTFMDVVRGQTLLLLVGTFVLAALMQKAANYALYVWMMRAGYMYFRTTSWFLYLLPAFLISGNLIKLYNHLANKKNPNSKSRAVLNTAGKKFKWSIVYSLLIGYLLLAVLVGIVIYTAKYLLAANYSQLLITLCLVGGLVLCYAILIFFMHHFNKFMCRITRTNETLMLALGRGELDDLLPEKERTRRAKIGMLWALSNASATSIPGAIIAYHVSVYINILMACGKVLGKALGKLLAFGYLIALMGASDTSKDFFRGYNDMLDVVELDLLAEHLVNITYDKK